MADDVLTTTDVARLLGISVRTAQLLIEGGGVPSWKTPGGHRRVHRADVAALLPGTAGGDVRRPATVTVVTDDARRAHIAERLGTGGYFSVRYETDVVDAALRAGQRAPGVVVVDLPATGAPGRRLLASLAADDRFRDTGLVAVASGPRAPPGLSPRVEAVNLDRLNRAVTALLREPVASADVVATGFPVAPNEPSRLAAVQRSGLVDTPPEVRFDRLATLAADTLHSPVALMTVLTGDRQWFKARQGLDLAETPRSWAFCNQTVLQQGVYEVADLADDPTFSTNPAVAGAPHFRHYAGAPYFDPDGFPLGSICVMDYRPRALDDTERRTLLDLAAVATDAVKLRGLAARH